jgi:hypothetical protein
LLAFPITGDYERDRIITIDFFDALNEGVDEATDTGSTWMRETVIDAI